MLIFLRGGVPHIDDGFGEVRPLREEEAQVLSLSVEALAEPDPEAEAAFAPEVRPHLATWRRALALSAVGSQEVLLSELDAVATVLSRGNGDGAAYLGGLIASARTWRGTLEGSVGDLAKARRWITAHPNGPGSRGIPLLIESTAGGGAKIIGGAGGKLNGQELGKLKPGAGGEAKNTREHKAEAEAAAAKPKLSDTHRAKRTFTSGGQRMSNTQFHAAGRPNWWVRNADTNEFLQVPYTRGDEVFSFEAASVKAGNYVVGVGPNNKHGIRYKATVLSDAAMAEKDAKKAADSTSAGTGSGGQGGPPPGAQMPLFKARLIIPITQRLAKSTLAPVATPAQQVRVGDTLAYWRENGTGLGVLQIPLASGKSLLVLAADLALALRDGADELARVLSGLAPARALIAKVGQLKTARKAA